MSLGISGLADVCAPFTQGMALTGSVSRASVEGQAGGGAGAVQLPPWLGAASTWGTQGAKANISIPPPGRTGQGDRHRERHGQGSGQSPASAAEATSPSARGARVSSIRASKIFPGCMKAVPAGCCRAPAAGLFPQPRPTLQLPQLHPAWAAERKNRWLSNQSPLSTGGFTPARHPLPLAFANRCPHHSCPLTSRWLW